MMVSDRKIVDIYACNDMALRSACENSHLEVAKFLVEKEPTFMLVMI